MTDSEEAKWYFLNAEKSPVGPYRASDVQALFTGGYVADDTLFWAEGLSEWKPLTTVDELQSVSREGATGPSVSAKPSTAASASAQAAGTGNGSGESAPVDPELAKFQSEIAGIEAGEDPGAGEESPPPDEREFEDDDGTKYAWDATLRKFVPAGGAAGGEPMPEYTIEQMTEPDRPTEVIPTLAEALAQEAAQDEQHQENKEGDGGKRGEGSEKAGAGEAEAETKEAGGKEGGEKEGGEKEGGEKEGGEKKRKGKQQQQQHWFELQNNTSVYVQGLPDDATVEEVAAVFKKCGIIKEEEDRRLRIKLYEDKSTGMRKGDGLVTYLKAPSVDLACQILDGTPLRDGLMPMKVEKAKFEMKGDVFKAKKRQKKKKGAAVAEQQERRMLNWGGFDDKIKAEEVTVVLKHMFAPKELEDDSTVLAELEADVRSECGKYGRVDRLNVFKHNPDGVIQVRYTRAEDAEKCIEVMNGRYFAGRRIEAAKWDGVTKHGAVRKDVEEEEAVRLAQYARELESGETAGARTAETPS